MFSQLFVSQVIFAPNLNFLQQFVKECLKTDSFIKNKDLSKIQSQ